MQITCGVRGAPGHHHRGRRGSNFFQPFADKVGQRQARGASTPVASRTALRRSIISRRGASPSSSGSTVSTGRRSTLFKRFATRWRSTRPCPCSTWTPVKSRPAGTPCSPCSNCSSPAWPPRSLLRLSPRRPRPGQNALAGAAPICRHNPLPWARAWRSPFDRLPVQLPKVASPRLSGAGATDVACPPEVR
jgi:hypothetical protein